MAEHGLWGWQVLPAANEPLREDQGLGDHWDIPVQIYFFLI